MGFPIRGDSSVVGDFRFAYPPPPGPSQIGVDFSDLASIGVGFSGFGPWLFAYAADQTNIQF
jgi:hypothetical protein